MRKGKSEKFFEFSEKILSKSIEISLIMLYNKHRNTKEAETPRFFDVRRGVFAIRRTTTKIVC